MKDNRDLNAIVSGLSKAESFINDVEEILQSPISLESNLKKNLKILKKIVLDLNINLSELNSIEEVASETAKEKLKRIKAKYNDRRDEDVDEKSALLKEVYKKELDAKKEQVNKMQTCKNDITIMLLKIDWLESKLSELIELINLEDTKEIMGMIKNVSISTNNVANEKTNNEIDKTDNFTFIPDDILKEILKFFSNKKLLDLRRVNKRFYSNISSLFKNDYDKPSQVIKFIPFVITIKLNDQIKKDLQNNSKKLLILLKPKQNAWEQKSEDSNKIVISKNNDIVLTVDDPNALTDNMAVHLGHMIRIISHDAVNTEVKTNLLSNKMFLKFLCLGFILTGLLMLLQSVLIGEIPEIDSYVPSNVKLLLTAISLAAYLSYCIVGFCCCIPSKKYIHHHGQVIVPPKEISAAAQKAVELKLNKLTFHTALGELIRKIENNSQFAFFNKLKPKLMLQNEDIESDKKNLGTFRDRQTYCA